MKGAGLEATFNVSSKPLAFQFPVSPFKGKCQQAKGYNSNILKFPHSKLPYS